ncbi:MAG: hypothetical protein QM621_12270 [Aeromicrobium sp.]|uniref:Ig-like domain-containing protein n=1 Tax=Aeromicrobium sp. TaxID=1871063 RepID=UPI0039E230F1
MRIQRFALVPVSALVVGLLSVGAATAPAQAYTDGGAGATDTTEDPDSASPTVLTSNHHWVGSNGQSAPTEAERQAFWDGGSVVIPETTAGGNYYSVISAAMSGPSECLDDGVVQLRAEANFKNNGPAAGAGYSGQFSFTDATYSSVLPGISGETEVGLSTNFPAGGDQDLLIHAQVPASQFADDGVRVLATVETNHNGVKSWTLSGFEATYRLLCPPKANDDSTTVVRGSSTPITVDLLANDDDEVETTETEPEITPSTVQLWDGSAWVAGPVTTDAGVYAVADGVLTFTPDPDYTGTAADAAIRYRVANDDASLWGSTVPDEAYGEATFTPNLTTAVVDDAATAPPGTPVTVDVLDNDGVANLDPDTLSLVDPDTGELVDELELPGVGVFTVVDGQIVFTPEDGFDGVVPPVAYVVEDEDGVPYSAELTVTVAGQATDDTATGTPGEPVTFTPLDNDDIPGGAVSGTLRLIDPATGQQVTELSVPGVGVWTVVGDTVVFTPADGFTGETPPVWYVVEAADGGLFSAQLVAEIVAPADEADEADSPLAALLPATGSAAAVALLMFAAVAGGLAAVVLRHRRRLTP